MTGMTIEKALNACGGRLCGEAPLSRELGRVVIDSREIRSEEHTSELQSR